MTQFITAEALAETLKDARADLFGSIETMSEIKVLKKERETKIPVADIVPHGQLFKHAKTTNIKTQGSYQTSVRNVNARFGGALPEFEAQSLPWGEWWENSRTIIVHKGVYYLRLQFPKNAKVETEYRDSRGRVYTYDEVKGILPSNELRENKEKKREANALRQGVLPTAEEMEMPHIVQASVTSTLLSLTASEIPKVLAKFNAEDTESLNERAYADLDLAREVIRYVALMRAVTIRNYKCTNILRLAYQGEVYEVIPTPTPAEATVSLHDEPATA